jgi:ribonuclease M5
MSDIRPHVKEAIVVEGRYDKNALSQVVDAVILETDGFQIFSEPAQMEMFRRIAQCRGIVVFTDPDGAGLVIRNYLKGSLPPDRVKHAYIPGVTGRERRKKSPSGEGTLGVEGMPPAMLLEALRRAGATLDDAETSVREVKITKAELYAAGLSGTPGAAGRRQVLLRELSLPSQLSSNALLDVLNALLSLEAFFCLTERLFLHNNARDNGQEQQTGG